MTLPEVLIVVAITTVIFTVLMTIFSSSFREATAGSRHLFALQELSAVIEYMKHDLRMLIEPSEQALARVSREGNGLCFEFQTVFGIFRDGSPICIPVRYSFENGTLTRTSLPLSNEGIPLPAKTRTLVKDKLELFELSILSASGEDITFSRSFDVPPARFVARLKHRDGARLETILNVYSPYIMAEADAAIRRYRIPNSKFGSAGTCFEALTVRGNLTFNVERLENIPEISSFETGGMMMTLRRNPGSVEPPPPPCPEPDCGTTIRPRGPGQRSR